MRGGTKRAGRPKKSCCISKNSLINGITLSGGEPLCQIEAVTELAKAAKDLGLDVWCYTGFDYRDVDRNFLKYVDVLVDGKFIEAQKDLALQFRGSKNQHLIDVAKSVDRIVLWQSDRFEKIFWADSHI